MNFFLTIIRFFCLTGLLVCVNLRLDAQNSTPKSEDYKKWTLEQLLFSIDSGFLDKEIRLDYIEFYLQKAKKENSVKDIVTGYKKKIANLKDYEIKSVYADSLIELAHKLKDKKVLGTAYHYKGSVEIVSKNYESALDYSLKAEEYLKNTDDLYTLNEVKNVIGISYFHLEEYEKAYKLSKETTNYHFKNKKKSYNNKKKYIIHLFGLSKSAYHLQKYDTLQILIQDGYTGIQELKTQHQPLETAYFSLIDGMYHHNLKNYPKSDSLLQVAIPEIKASPDFANEHLAYLFLGKNLWEQNKKEQALGYFAKTDSLYQTKKFINAELAEAYKYIIDYYKEQKNTEKQLYYTNVLLQISNELQSKHKNLTDYLHTNLETKELEQSKAKLENQIGEYKKWSKGIYAVIVFLVVTFLFLLIRHKKTKQKQVAQPQTKSTPKSVLSTASDDVSNTEQIILKRLERFEQDKGYLDKDITLEKLSKELMTNRTTLSQTLNEHKDGFKKYIKTLRINNAINEINNDPQLKHHNLDILADKFGFITRKAFAVAFKEVTKTPISNFLKPNKQSTNN